MSKTRIDNHGVGFGIRERDVERQAFHERYFEVLKFVPEWIVDVEGVHRPLERGPYPQLGWHGNQPSAQLNAPTFALGCQPFQGEGYGNVVRSVTINVHEILKQHEIGAHQQFTGEGSRIPCLVGRAVVSGREIHVNGVGVDTDAKEVVKAEVLNGKQRLPKVVWPCIGVGCDIGEEFVRARMINLHGRGVSQFDLLKESLCVSQSIARTNLSFGSIQERK